MSANEARSVWRLQNPGAWSFGTILVSPSHVATPPEILSVASDWPPITGSFTLRHCCVVAGAPSNVVRISSEVEVEGRSGIALDVAIPTASTHTFVIESLRKEWNAAMFSDR